MAFVKAFYFPLWRELKLATNTLWTLINSIVFRWKTDASAKGGPIQFWWNVVEALVDRQQSRQDTREAYPYRDVRIPRGRIKTEHLADIPLFALLQPETNQPQTLSFTTPHFSPLLSLTLLSREVGENPFLPPSGRDRNSMMPAMGK